VIEALGQHNKPTEWRFLLIF